MKIAFTIADLTDSINGGGEINRTTYVVQLLESQLPRDVIRFLEMRDQDATSFESMSISLVKE